MLGKEVEGIGIYDAEITEANGELNFGTNDLTIIGDYALVQLGRVTAGSITVTLLDCQCEFLEVNVNKFDLTLDSGYASIGPTKGITETHVIADQPYG